MAKCNTKATGNTKAIGHGIGFAETPLGQGPVQIDWAFVQQGETDRKLQPLSPHFIEEGGHISVYPTSSVPTSPLWFFKVSKEVQNWWQKTILRPYNPSTDSGTLRTLTLREGIRSGEKMGILTVSGNPDFMINRTQIEGFKEAALKALPKEIPTLFLRIQISGAKEERAFYEYHLYGPDCISDMLFVQGKTLIFKRSPGSLLHPPCVAWETIYRQALTLSQPKPTETVLDLYAGIGTFSILFAPYVKTVFAAEASAYALCDAKRNIEANNLSNIVLFKAQPGAAFSNIPGSVDLGSVDLGSVDLVVLCPPRSEVGSNITKKLLNLSPKKLLCCLPNATSQKEIISFFQKEGYQVSMCKLRHPVFDAHPLNNIAVLQKRGIS